MFEKYKIKKILKPRKEFAAQTKTTFLAVFDATHPGSRIAHGFTALAKTLVAAGALVALLGSMSVYADTANVAADSPLYPLKRLGESVQLAVAAPAAKAELQATFATRRANEISDLETRKPSSTIVAGLSNDLNTAINTSLSDAQNADLGDGQLTNFCDKVLSAIATSSITSQSDPGAGHFHVALNARAQIIGKFVNQCGADLDNDATSTTASGTSTVTESTSTSPTPFQLFRRLFPMMPSSTIDNASGTNPQGAGDDGGGKGKGDNGNGGSRRPPFFYRLPPGIATSTASSTASTTSSTAPHSPFQRLFPDANTSTTINVTSSVDGFGIWKKLFGN